MFPELKILKSHFIRTGTMAKSLGISDIEYAYLSCVLMLNNGEFLVTKHYTFRLSITATHLLTFS